MYLFVLYSTSNKLLDAAFELGQEILNLWQVTAELKIENKIEKNNKIKI